jgi:hypothetical protein
VPRFLTGFAERVYYKIDFLFALIVLLKNERNWVKEEAFLGPPGYSVGAI